MKINEKLMQRGKQFYNESEQPEPIREKICEAIYDHAVLRQENHLIGYD
jgi:hypothetical protein